MYYLGELYKVLSKFSPTSTAYLLLSRYWDQLVLYLLKALFQWLGCFVYTTTTAYFEGQSFGDIAGHLLDSLKNLGKGAGKMFGLSSKFSASSGPSKGKATWTCDIEDCGKIFQKAYYLVQHKRVVHFPPASYLCLWDYCTFHSAYKRSVVRHLHGKHALDAATSKEEIAALVGTLSLD